MNPDLRRLLQIAQKPVRHIIGLMSGTSLDGLDVALCRFEGSGVGVKVSVVAFDTVGYTDEQRFHIGRVFASRQLDLQDVCLLHARIGRLHAQMVLDCLQKWSIKPSEIDLIASHGQTVFHAPRRQHGIQDWPDATLQIGDADHIAHITGIITVSDFRQKHVAAGGEGAPLAGYGDFLLFGSATQPRILLNIGGIANFTYLPAPPDPTAVFATDTGPGNTLMDALARRDFGKLYDDDGAIARSGHINTALLSALLAHPYFGEPTPKTTGPEVFYLEQNGTENANSIASIIGASDTPSGADLMATLCRFSAETIANEVQKSIGARTNFVAYTSGGGAHNTTLINHLRDLLPQVFFRAFDELGISGDAKEAVLFAALANETVAGPPINWQGRAGMPNVNMGKISLPN